MDESKQTERILACWFVNKLWHNLYIEVCEDEDVVESFRNTILKFNTRLKSDIAMERRYDTPYIVVLEGILKYYNSSFNRSKTLKKFNYMIYDVIVGNYADDKDSLSDEKIETIVRSVILNTVNVFIVYIADNESDNILNRKSKSIPQTWVDKFINVWGNKVRKYRSLLIATRNGVDVANNADVEMVPLATVKKYETKIKELLAQIKAMTIDHNYHVNVIKVLMAKIRKQEQLSTSNLINTSIKAPANDLSDLSSTISRVEQVDINNILVDNIELDSDDKSYDSFEELSSGDEFEITDL